MSRKILLYGPYGYSGKLILDELLKQRIGEPLLVGRNKEELELLANAYTLDFDIAESHDLTRVLKKHQTIEVLINAAGPFIKTADSIVQACIENAVHYVDITGEIDVFKLVHGYDSSAKKAGIMLMSGTGFDVAPTDCLAKKLQEYLPDANVLEMAFAQQGGGISRGTALTSILSLQAHSLIRENGSLKKVAWNADVREINFGPFKRWCLPIPWGDLETAWISTGIPNIKVFMPLPKRLIKSITIFSRVLQVGIVRKAIMKYISSRLTGPSQRARDSAQTHVIGMVKNEHGDEHKLHLITPDGYTFTALCTAEIVRRILNGKLKLGYQTPSMAYGSDFVNSIKGVSWMGRN